MSFRLGGTDGVSIEAAKWAWALSALGFDVRTVAGEGGADLLLRGLGRSPSDGPPDAGAVADALDGADVVVVENLLSLPLHPAAATVVARVLRDRPAVLKHHDLPWQRAASAAWDGPPDEARWAHVTINEHSRRELSSRRGVEAVVRHNRFPLDGWLPPAAHEGRVVLHPARAIPRKDVPAAVRLAEGVGATYWLTGPAEDGYDDELRAVLAAAACPVRHEPAPSIAAAYAACDVVAFPSRIEGFGNPVVESALARRPLAIHRYPVAEEDLAPFGFRWLDAHDPAAVAAWLHDPDPSLLDDNEAIARAAFGLDRLPTEVAEVLERVL